MNAPVATPARPSFRMQMHQAREDAILLSANRLLAEKGYDAMTLDEVAAAVGIAKASLYKHFPSKEALAAAAMVQVMRATQAVLDGLDPASPPLERLKAVVRWAMQVQLDGQMPSLPSENSALQQALLHHEPYMDGLVDVSLRLTSLIEAAQHRGDLAPDLPTKVVLMTLFARACDPVLGYLKRDGGHSDAQIVDWVLQTCFDGLRAR